MADGKHIPMITGEVSLPSDADIPAEVKVQIWENDANPYRAVECVVRRCGGSLQIDFGSVGELKDLQVFIRFNDDRELEVEVLREGNTTEKVLLISDRHDLTRDGDDDEPT